MTMITCLYVGAVVTVPHGLDDAAGPGRAWARAADGMQRAAAADRATAGARMALRLTGLMGVLSGDNRSPLAMTAVSVTRCAARVKRPGVAFAHVPFSTCARHRCG